MVSITVDCVLIVGFGVVVGDDVEVTLTVGEGVCVGVAVCSIVGDGVGVICEAEDVEYQL